MIAELTPHYHRERAIFLHFSSRPIHRCLLPKLPVHMAHVKRPCSGWQSPQCPALSLDATPFLGITVIFPRHCSCHYVASASPWSPCRECCQEPLPWYTAVISASLCCWHWLPSPALGLFCTGNLNGLSPKLYGALWNCKDLCSLFCVLLFRKTSKQVVWSPSSTEFLLKQPSCD